MDTYGLTAEQAGDGSPDVVSAGSRAKGKAKLVRTTAGDRLPFGADVFPDKNEPTTRRLRPVGERGDFRRDVVGRQGLDITTVPSAPASSR